MQISEPCYESIKATNTFIYSLSLSPMFRFRTGVPGPDLTDARPKVNPLVRPPLPLLWGKNGKR